MIRLIYNEFVKQCSLLRKLGGYEGQIKIADDFDDIPEGFEEYHDGKIPLYPVKTVW